MGHDDPDVFIVGGGPIGLATAIALRLRGSSVTLAEGRRPPLAQACGEGLQPDGARFLARLGVVVPEQRSFRIRGLCFRDGAESLSADFQGGTGLGVSRVILHHALVQRAMELGVVLRWGSRVRWGGAQRLQVNGVDIKARWLVAADGVHSGIRHRAGLDGPIRYRRSGLRRHYQMAPWSDRVEVTFASACESYVTPISDNTICVAILTGAPGKGFDRHLQMFPQLSRRLHGAGQSCPERGGVTVFQEAASVVSGNLALAGDAAFSTDAISGEGLSLGFRQADCLAQAIAAGDLSRYEKRHASLVRVPRLMTRFLLSVHRHPPLRRSLFRLLPRFPQCLDWLVQVHARGTLAGSGPESLEA